MTGSLPHRSLETPHPHVELLRNVSSKGHGRETAMDRSLLRSLRGMNGLADRLETNPCQSVATMLHSIVAF